MTSQSKAKTPVGEEKRCPTCRSDDPKRCGLPESLLGPMHEHAGGPCCGDPFHYPEHDQEPCPTCHGNGYVLNYKVGDPTSGGDTKPCPDCNGTGSLPDPSSNEGGERCPDWTSDGARSNSSPEFLALAERIGRLIRSEAHSLVVGQTASVGRLVAAHLAHAEPQFVPASRLTELQAELETQRRACRICSDGMTGICAVCAELCLTHRLHADRDDALSALRVIRGPADDQDVWMDAYREAGGGYEGLQAVARAALEAIDAREQDAAFNETDPR